MNPVNVPDPEAFTARVQPESGRVVYNARADFLDPFQFRLSTAGVDRVCTELTRIRSGWPGQGLAKRIWSGRKPVCRNHQAWFLAGHKRPAGSFPLSDSVPFFHRRPG